jgi:hypothetical protein
LVDSDNTFENVPTRQVVDREEDTGIRDVNVLIPSINSYIVVVERVAAAYGCIAASGSCESTCY